MMIAAQERKYQRICFIRISNTPAKDKIGQLPYKTVRIDGFCFNRFCEVGKSINASLVGGT